MATEAYVEINMGLQHAAKKKGPITKTYLAHRQEHFDELRILHAELAAETAASASGGSEEEDEEEEEDEDADDAEGNGAILAAIAEEETLAAAGDAASSSSAESLPQNSPTVC